MIVRKDEVIVRKDEVYVILEQFKNNSIMTLSSV